MLADGFIASGSSRAQTPPAYEPPHVETLGSLYDLTQTICIFNKTLGSPDYWSRIPIANCSG